MNFHQKLSRASHLDAMPGASEKLTEAYIDIRRGSIAAGNAAARQEHRQRARLGWAAGRCGAEGVG